MLEQSGFDQVQIGPPYDTFGDARGEVNARAFAVFGYTFSPDHGSYQLVARVPERSTPFRSL